MQPTTEPLLRVINLTKHFGTLPAVQQVSFNVYPGEVLGLAGQSGSGKTVIASLLASLHTPDSGDLYLAGRRLEWPFPARRLGIELIRQQPDLVEQLDVASNLFMGNEIGWPAWGRWFKVPNRRRIDQETRRILQELEIRARSPREKVANLAAEERQLVAIGRALTHTPKLVVIDEPTALLGYGAQQKLLQLAERWRQSGVAVIFCSNNLDHLFAVTDRIVVLRHGRWVAVRRTDATTREELVNLMVGTPDRQQLTPMIWALDSYYRAHEQAEQLRTQETQLQGSLAAKDSMNQQLVERLAQQVTALDRANLSLQDAQRRLLTEREHERKHLARELHDQTIQDLLSINYELEALSGEAAATPPLVAGVEEIRHNIRDLVDELRRICGNLRPPTIDSLGLGAAIQSYIRDWSERTGIGVSLDVDPQLGRLPEAIELSLFRIVQEGLQNVRKHARATEVEVLLKHTSPRALLIAIADNGRGLPPGSDLATLASEGHYGLLGISERVALLGGRLGLHNRSGGGLQMRVEIPHPRVETSVEAAAQTF